MIDDALAPPAVEAVDLSLPFQVETLPGLDRPMAVHVREVPLIAKAPWVRTLGKLALDVTTHGWRFPTPVEATPALKIFEPSAKSAPAPSIPKQRTRLKPPGDMVLFKDRLLYLLQPALEDIFAGKQVELPFAPYPYQIKGIAFLMPRHAALLADEMGLGKTAQVLIALRLLFHGGLI